MLSFFQKLACGIDISDYSIELLCIEKNVGKARVSGYGRKILENGIVEDGRIIDKGKLASELHKLTEYVYPRSLRSSRVVSSIPESKTFIHVFSLPADLSGGELYQAAESEAKKILPFAEKEVYVDVMFGENSGNNNRQVLYAACEKRIIDDFFETFERAGLQLSVLDLESASIARALLHARPMTEPFVIMDMGARTINVTIYGDGLIQFSSTIFLGGTALTGAISRALSILPEKAELLKREAGFNPEKEGGRIMLVLQKEFQHVIEELEKTMRFYQEKTGREVARGILVGGTSLVPALVEYLNVNTRVRFELASPLENIDAKVLADAKDASGTPTKIPHGVILANVIGLALRGAEGGMERRGVNLLPKKPDRWLERVIHS